MSDPVTLGTAARIVYGAWSLVSGGGGLNPRQRAALDAARSAGYTRAPRGWRDPTGQAISQRDAIRAGKRILAGGSVADLPPAPATSSAPPVWYAAIPVFAKMGEPARPRPNIGKATWEAQREEALRKYLKQSKGKIRLKRAAKTLRRVLPKVAAPILKRIPKGAGPIVAAQVAYTVGYEIGTQLYRAYERYAYGPARPARPAAGAPGVTAPGRPAPRPQAPAPAAPAAAPRAPAPAPRARTPANPRPTPAPAPSAVPATAPAVASAPAVATAPAPAPARSSMTLPKLWRGVQAAGLAYALVQPRSVPKSATRPAPLTGSNAPPLGLSPNVRTAECKCEPKRKRSSAQRCRNPVIRRTKRTRGGQKFITITRRVEC